MKKIAAVIVCLALSTLAEINNMEPSQLPPGGIAVEDAPMFVCFGWDDNRYPDGVYWSDSIMQDINNPDGSAAKGTYFVIGNAAENDATVAESWRFLYQNGHEIANHTWTHGVQLKNMDSAGWFDEIDRTNELIINEIGVPREEIYGFRTPRLAFSDATFSALKAVGFLYECTIQFGFDWWTLPGNDAGYSPSNPRTGKNLWWPMTMDHPWPEGTHNSADQIGRCPGMWEIMVYTYANPGASYDFAAENDPSTVSIVTGFDYNIFKEKSATGNEFARWMKYSLLQRLQGNRAPFTVNCHTDVFSEFNESANGEQGAFATKNFQERREGMEDFLQFAASFEDVYIVPYIDMIEWMNAPKTLAQMAEGVSVDKGRKVAPKSGADFISLKSFELSMRVPVSGMYAVTVHDMSGRIIQKSQYALDAGVGTVQLSKHLANGIYAVTVRGESINKSALLHVK